MATLDDGESVGGGRNLARADLEAEIAMERSRLQEERGLLEGARLLLATSLAAGPEVDLSDLIAQRAQLVAGRESIRKEMSPIAEALAAVIEKQSGGVSVSKAGQKKVQDWDGNLFSTFDSREAGVDMKRSMFFRRLCSDSRRQALLEDGIKLKPAAIVEEIFRRAHGKVDGLLPATASAGWPSVIDLTFVQTLRIFDSEESFERFLLGNVSSLADFLPYRVPFDSRNINCITEGLENLEKVFTAFLGTEWDRCTSALIAFIREQMNYFRRSFSTAGFRLRGICSTLSARSLMKGL
jgi:hypothetical protein